MSKIKIIISVVIYEADLYLLQRAFQSLLKALELDVWDVELFIRNNSTSFPENLQEVINFYSKIIKVSYVSGGGNVGYGKGHNQCLNECCYHVILNPDLEVAPDALKIAIKFMEQNPSCGLLTPFATWDDGKVQRLCKSYPTVFDLLLRGFAPDFVKNIFKCRLAKYEMANQLNEQDIYWDPPIVSGCFMLFRTEVLKKIGGFDPRFFLYFEDFDISLRTAKVSRIAYVPQVKVVHHGGHASRKGWRHIKMFGRSMITFFNIHGWRWW